MPVIHDEKVSTKIIKKFKRTIKFIEAEECKEDRNNTKYEKRNVGANGGHIIISRLNKYNGISVLFFRLCYAYNLPYNT